MNSRTHNRISCTAKGDSGASSHFWREEDAAILRNIHQGSEPLVKFPNSRTVDDDKVGYLPFEGTLSKRASKVCILSELKSASLISLGQLADDCCQTKILRDHLYIYKIEKLSCMAQETEHMFCMISLSTQIILIQNQKLHKIIFLCLHCAVYHEL